MNYSNTNKNNFIQGLYSGIPIGLGYLAVSFSLGITAANSGLSVFQSFFASLFCLASAGEYAGFTLIKQNAPYIEIALITLIINARYCLMSFALSQKISPDTSFFKRLCVSYGLTDEIFGVSMAQKGYLNPFFNFGAILAAAPCWAIGSALGTAAGNILPLIIVSSLSVALFGMFLAVIIPPAREDKKIIIIIVVCFVLSYLTTIIPVFSDLSDGTRIIILTIVLSSLAAIIFPIKDIEVN